jgi:hypothetical protein
LSRRRVCPYWRDKLIVRRGRYRAFCHRLEFTSKHGNFSHWLALANQCNYHTLTFALLSRAILKKRFVSIFGEFGNFAFARPLRLPKGRMSSLYSRFLSPHYYDFLDKDSIKNKLIYGFTNDEK